MHRDVNPKKFLGQHFLIDDNISKKIVEAINFQKYNLLYTCALLSVLGSFF